MEADPIPTTALVAKFNISRQGVTDPARLVVAELKNITDVLLEPLKEYRQQNRPKRETLTVGYEKAVVATYQLANVFRGHSRLVERRFRRLADFGLASAAKIRVLRLKPSRNFMSLLSAKPWTAPQFLQVTA